MVFELWNVLTQLSFTILLTYFLIKKPFRLQLAISFGLLVLTELMYRLYDPSAPFVKGENLGSFTDILLMGKISGGGWVAINCIPTAAHTLWGAMCGNILLTKKSSALKIKYFVFSGLGALALGYGLDWMNITPIIKRICTSSFVLASGGWAILVLAFFFWMIDVKKLKNWTFMFVIVGMNSIFIYLFAQLLGHNWLSNLVHIFNYGLFGAVGFPQPYLAFLNAVFTLAIMWYLCYFLYKKKVFFKI
jgi:predicted acyltransferase